MTSPKGLAELLVTKSYQFKRPDMVAKVLAPIVGEGILLTEGEVHKAQRRNLMPAFAFRHVKNLYPVFWRKAGEVTDAMAATADGDGDVAELDVLDWATRCTLDIIGVAGLGVDFGSIRDPANPLAETYKTLMGGGTRSRLLMVLRVLLPAWMVERLPIRQNMVMQKGKHTLRRVCADLIRDRKRRTVAAGADKDDCDILSVGAGERPVQRRQPRRPAHDVPRGGPRDHGHGPHMGGLPPLVPAGRAGPAAGRDPRAAATRRR